MNKILSMLKVLLTVFIYIFLNLFIAYSLNYILKIDNLNSLIISEFILSIYLIRVLKNKTLIKINKKDFFILNILIILISIIIKILVIYISKNTNLNIDISFIDNSSVYIVFIFIIISSIFEEFLFRGLILEKLKMNFSYNSSLIFSSLLFSLVHFNFLQIIYTFFLGIFFAKIKEKNGIILAIYSHLVYNLIQVSFKYL